MVSLCGLCIDLLCYVCWFVLSFDGWVSVDVGFFY